MLAAGEETGVKITEKPCTAAISLPPSDLGSACGMPGVPNFSSCGQSRRLVQSECWATGPNWKDSETWPSSTDQESVLRLAVPEKDRMGGKRRSVGKGAASGTGRRRLAEADGKIEEIGSMAHGEQKRMMIHDLSSEMDQDTRM